MMTLSMEGTVHKTFTAMTVAKIATSPHVTRNVATVIAVIISIVWDEWFLS